MAEICFHHPKIPKDLNIGVKPDQIQWTYGLNTMSYPTYGGEVVQILSIYVGDLTVKGTVATYAHMEAIYGWFITYMQYATQGVASSRSNHYNQQPVEFTYFERDWKFQIWPKSLPGFRYGRDVVTPEWTLVAAVKEPDEEFVNRINDLALSHLRDDNMDPAGAFKVTADFGDTGDLENNPWASPDADPSAGKDISAYLDKEVKKLADTYQGFLQAYTQNQLDGLPQFKGASGPPDLSGAAADKATKVIGKTK